ncbi:MAG TPA: hypothetical protein VHA33_18200 [Candidatus Angelobacter sp.]|nr:hypothetical protein [Candidatus Angelobacter sp.]
MKQTTNSASPSSPTSGEALCVCTDTEPTGSDFRTNAKHETLPQIAANEISVGTILSWPVLAEPAFDAPRQGRELQLFHISQAFLQFAWLNTGDCDLHLEISDSQDKNAPRVIVETPFGDTFCSARRQLGAQLSARGFTLSSNSGELPTAVAVDVMGLAFQDFNHPRGTSHVATVWELHPAIVTVK